jgi:hypothetical protein
MHGNGRRESTLIDFAILGTEGPRKNKERERKEKAIQSVRPKTIPVLGGRESLRKSTNPVGSPSPLPHNAKVLGR